MKIFLKLHTENQLLKKEKEFNITMKLTKVTKASPIFQK